MAKRRQQTPPTPTLAPPSGNGKTGKNLNRLAGIQDGSNAREVPLDLADKIIEVTANIPVWPNSVGNPGVRHTDCQLGQPEALKLKKIMLALRAQHATLKSGRLVNSQADSVQWMLEQLDIPTPQHELRGEG